MKGNWRAEHQGGRRKGSGSARARKGQGEKLHGESKEVKRCRRGEWARVGVRRTREEGPLNSGSDTPRMKRERGLRGNQRQVVEQAKGRAAIPADATEDGH